jgi:lipopolysaccharide/colanic/teichoic acid biosynthesis glycosyltransferase
MIELRNTRVDQADIWLPDDRLYAETSSRVLPDSRWYSSLKRTFDIAFALGLGLFTAPIWMVAALLIKLTSRGPIIYRQTRCGRGGRHFTCYKFRTMQNGAHERRHELLHLNHMSGPVFKAVNDPRVTPLGRWLRKTSIDELPQLINVLRGEMSIVGPRPAIPEEVAQYTPVHQQRLRVKPGLTCIWQVSGRSAIGFERWMALDLEYVRRRGFWYDCRIVARTVPAVLRGRGAY